MLEIFLEFALVLALAGFFVMWAKWEEQKLKTREERDRRWDEISLRQSAEKELEQEKKLGVEREDEIFRLSVWHNIMQDKLSSILCPTNNHVWKDGVCAKCGRVHEP